MHHDHDPPKEGEAHIVEHEIALLVGGVQVPTRRKFRIEDYETDVNCDVAMAPRLHVVREAVGPFVLTSPDAHQDLILSISKHLTKPCYPDQHARYRPPLSDYLPNCFLCMPRSARRAGTWSCFLCGDRMWGEKSNDLGG